MDELNICFRGPRGCGKRTTLLENLEIICKRRGFEWHVTQKMWMLETPKESDMPSGEVEDDSDITHAKGTVIPYESSPVHIGFDVARMSMQDKIYLQSIITKLGTGTEVLVGKQKKISGRIIVLYHTQYLSHESVMLLHATLEKSEGSILLWITTEESAPMDLEDLFLTIPVGGPDRKLAQFLKEHPTIPEGYDGQAWIDSICNEWMTTPWNLERIDKIREFVYICLLRNIRWQDSISYWIDALLKNVDKLGKERYRATFAAICNAEATASSQTSTTYRIPISHEYLYMHIAKALAPL